MYSSACSTRSTFAYEALTFCGTLYVSGGSIQTVSLPSLESVNSLNIAYNNITNLTLPKLQSAGYLEIAGCKFLKSLSFPSLRHANDVFIREGIRLSILNFSALETVGSLRIFYSNQLKSIDLPRLREVSTLLDIFTNRALVSISLNALQSVSDVSISSNRNLVSISSLCTSLKVINGTLVEVCANSAKLVLPTCIPLLGLGKSGTRCDGNCTCAA